MPYSGGYVLHRTPLVRSFLCPHTSALDNPISQDALDAVNTIQATPWQINGFVLDCIRYAYDSGIEIGNVTFEAKPEVPTRLDDEAYEAMSPEDRKAHRARLARIHQKRASIEGRSQALLDKLSVAEELTDRPAIYYPHTMDFRGRIYPQAVNGPHPQGDDVGKALIRFAEGVELGQAGLYWLCVRAANCYGHDKLPLDERVAWAFDHTDQFIAAASDPFEIEALRWWSAADEPWQFLATCEELAYALTADAPEDFVSFLPVPMDGTCNGLQHLSAMGLDPIGAEAVNLTTSPERKDIYETVAKRVAEMVAEDVLAGHEIAMAWHGKITRKTVKRAVMTTPYGVTDSGIRGQLISDGVVPVEGEQRGEAASYLCDRLGLALSETVVAAREIMAWLQTVAKRLAEQGEAFEWTTPHGCRIRQEYLAMSEVRITTLAGRFQLFKPVGNGMLNERKQALGSAPNFIHSFDAAHLAMTVNRAAVAGITSFSMIHDSYGTHAGKTQTLARILREVFVDIYRTDQIGALADELAERFPHVDLPPVPARGSFNIEETLDSPFFFS